MQHVDWALAAIGAPVTTIGLLMVFAPRHAAKWNTSVGPKWTRNASYGITPIGPGSSRLRVVLTGVFILGVGVFILLAALG